MKRLFISISIILLMSVAHAESPLTLDQSILMGLRNNDAVIVAQEKVDAAQSKVTQAFSGYLPNLKLGASYTKAYVSPAITKLLWQGAVMTLPFGIDEPAEIKGWSAAVTENVFTFGKLENALGIALDSSKAAKEDLRKAQQETIYNVTSAYYGYIKAVKMADLAKEALDMAGAHLEQVKAMLNAGISTKADVLRSQVSLSSSTQVLIKAKSALEMAKAVFNNSIGRDLESDVAVEQIDLSTSVSGDDYDYPSLLKNAFEFRPDSRQAGIALDIANKNAGLAVAQWMPSVQLQAGYQWTNTNYNINAVNYDSSDWDVVGAVSWNIFDGLNTQAKIKEADANKDVASANKSQIIKNVELDVKRAYLDYASAKEVLDTAKAGLESAQENYNVAKLRFENGLATNIEMLDAQTALTKTETDLLTAQFDLELSKAEIAKACGLIDLKGRAAGMNELVLEGTVKFYDLEGGFLGFTDKTGKKYQLSGSMADELLKKIDQLNEGKNVVITGYLKAGTVSINMWGTPLEIERFEWK